jgi:hypothetical protein
MTLLFALPLLLLSLPPAAKVLAVMGSVYGLLFGLKKIPALTPYLTGTVAIALNVVTTVLGLLLALPAEQLYTSNTLVLIVTTVLGSAGIHGTVKAMSPPQVLATHPPDPTVKEVPATLVPIDPAAVAVDPHKPLT